MPVKKKVQPAEAAAPGRGGRREGSGRKPKRAKKVARSVKFDLQTLKDIRRFAKARKTNLNHATELMIQEHVEALNSTLSCSCGARPIYTWGGMQETLAPYGEK